MRSACVSKPRSMSFLQRHVTLIHDSYRRLTTEFVTQFQLIESAVSNFIREPEKPAVSLAEEQEPASDT